MNNNQVVEPLTINVAEEVIKRTDKSKEMLIELEQKYRAAGKFLDEATDHIKVSWVDWLKESAKYLEEVRTWRMAMESEVRKGKDCSKDILDFLATDDTKQKLIVLRELVEISERLKALKDSGFLDDVVDILLKVK